MMMRSFGKTLESLMNKYATDQMYLEMAYVAARQSHDPHKKVGAIIVKGNQILAYGFNGTPTNYPNNECKDEEGKTFSHVVHAEINAIAKAAEHGVSTKGATLYSTTVPCIECAKIILQCGITRVIYVEDYNKCEEGKTLLEVMPIIFEQKDAFSEFKRKVFGLGE